MDGEDGPTGDRVSICVVRRGSSWFGIAYHGAALVATSVATNRERARGAVARSLSGVPHQPVAEVTGFVADTVQMLTWLEEGKEEHKRFTLSRRYVPEPLRAVLWVAASIPLGYVTTYGNIATAAGAEARVVGGVMAANPLYPIVPCHRVVGFDLGLVGYGGRQDPDALRAKLARLRREARGHSAKVVVPETSLEVYPVEWAISKARRDGVDTARQLTLFG